MIRAFVRAPRFEPLRRLVAEDARIGDDEKDGVVVNRYLNAPGSISPRLGWHTDGLRDLFYLRMPQAMLNVGLHLDACPAENGGLRLIPGSHRQGFASMCLRKAYFVKKRVQHMPERRCYVLGFTVGGWLKRAARAAEVQQRIGETVTWPGETLILNLEGDNYRFGRKLRWMRGSRIL